MKKKVVKGRMKTAFGKPLKKLTVKGPGDTVLPYSGPRSLPYSREADQFESIEEMRSKNEYPNDDQILKYKNRDKRQAARQAAMTASIESAGFIEPTLKNDPQLRLEEAANNYRINKLQNATDEQRADAAWVKQITEEARQKASEFLGIEWEEDEEEEEEEEEVEA